MRTYPIEFFKVRIVTFKNPLKVNSEACVIVEICLESKIKKITMTKLTCVLMREYDIPSLLISCVISVEHNRFEMMLLV